MATPPECGECDQPILDTHDTKQCDYCGTLMHWVCSIQVATDDDDEDGYIYLCRKCHAGMEANEAAVAEERRGAYQDAYREAHR